MVFYIGLGGGGCLSEDIGVFEHLHMNDLWEMMSDIITAIIIAILT